MEGEPKIPRNTIEDAIPQTIREKMESQAATGAAPAETSPDSIEVEEKKPPVENETAGLTPEDLTEIDQEVKAMEREDSEAKNKAGQEYDRLAKLEKRVEEPIKKNPAINNPEIKIPTQHDRLIDSGLATPPESIGMKGARSYPRPEYSDSLARIEQYAKIIQQKYEEILSESGGNFAKAAEEAREELDRLTANNKELKNNVLKRVERDIELQKELSDSKGKVKLHTRVPENLPVPQAVGETTQPPVSSDESTTESKPVETEEERSARIELEMAAHEEQTRGGGLEKETELPKETPASEPEPTPEENIQEFWKITSQELQTYNEDYLTEILMALPPNVAAEFIGHLPDQLQADVTLKIATAETGSTKPAEEEAEKYLIEYRKLFPEVGSAPEPTPEEKEDKKVDEERESIGTEAVKEESEKPPLVEAEELTPEEIKALEKIEKPEDAEKLPQEIKEKLGLGFSNLGFFVEENKNKFFAGALEKTLGGLDKGKTLGRFVSSLAENFRRDEENAKKKFEAVKQGQKQHLSNAGYLTGNIMKYGRIAADFAGWTIASPLRYVTLSAMLFGRGAEAAKEARLKNEELIEKNRLDAQAAIEEGWKVYEMAQAKAGDKEVGVEELKKAYLENLPEDIKNRLLAKYDIEEKTRFTTTVARGILESGIDFATTRLQDKLDKIDENEKLSDQEKEQEKEKLLNKYSKKLHDYDRMISQYGTVDALAMGARYAETLSKGIVYGVMIESAYIGLSKLWENLAGVLGEKPDLHLAALEKGIGIGSKDGIDKLEAAKIGRYIAEHSDKQREILKQYGHIKVEGTNKTVGEYILEKIKEPTLPPAEEIHIPKPAPEIPSTPPTAPFESVLPQLDHPETVHEGSNVWNTTREILLYRKPEELKQLGFDVPRRIGPNVDNPEFAEKLSHWADAKTSELLNQYAQEHGGKMPDLVHEGDKVLLEKMPDGQLHLKVLDSHGNELEPSSAEATTETKPEQPPMSDEETKALEEKLQHRVMEEELPAPTETEAPTVEIPPAVETPKTPLTELVQKLKEIESLTGSQETKVANAVKEYITAVTNSEKYDSLKIEGEKLNTFALMFPMKGIAERIEDIDTPEELAKAVETFNNKLHLATEALIKGELKGLTKGDSIFPVESADGARIYFSQPLGNNEWQILKTGPTGQPYPYQYQYIQNPFKNFWAGDKLKFNLKDVIKILGYKK